LFSRSGRIIFMGKFVVIAKTNMMTPLREMLGNTYK
jgi:hypothetical protein